MAALSTDPAIDPQNRDQLAKEWNRTKELIRRLIDAWTTAQQATKTEDETRALATVDAIVQEMKYVNNQYLGRDLPNPIDNVEVGEITGTQEQRNEIQNMTGGYRYKTPKNRRKTKTKSKTKSKSPSKSKKSKKSRRKSKY